MCRASQILLLAIAFSGGCRGLPQRPSLPATHQTPDHQLVFHCDFELAPEHRLVRELNDEREYIATTLGLSPSTERIDVYLFRDSETYGRYLAQRFPKVPPRRAFFVESDASLAVYAHWSDRVAEDLRHEVAHGYLHAMVPGLPLWLDEGLAEYFEVPRGQAGLNRPHLELLSDMTQHNGWRPNLARLESLTDAAQMDQCDYAEAWAWVYFMMSHLESRELLTGYLIDLQTFDTTESLPSRIAKRHTPLNLSLAQFLRVHSATSAAGNKPLRGAPTVDP